MSALFELCKRNDVVMPLNYSVIKADEYRY